MTDHTPAEYQATMAKINQSLFTSSDGVINVVQRGSSSQAEFVNSLRAKLNQGQAITASDLDRLESQTQQWTQPAISTLQSVREFVTS